MKLKVEKQFRDKNTGERYNVKDIIEVNDIRGKELLADKRGLVTKVAEKKSRKKFGK